MAPTWDAVAVTARKMAISCGMFDMVSRVAVAAQEKKKLIRYRG